MPADRDALGIVPISHELTVETPSGEGRAIAYQWLGNNGIYLVVSTTEVAAPRWVSDQDINAAYIGERPGKTYGRAAFE